MKTEQMSTLTRSLCNYAHQYMQEASRDKTLAGSLKASLTGRAILLVFSFILHAEAVCRAVYVCFLTIKQVFSQPTEELLLAKQKGECTVAYDASLRSFFAALFSQKLITPLNDSRTNAHPQIKNQPQLVPQAPARIPEARRLYQSPERLPAQSLPDSDEYEYRSLSKSSQGLHNLDENLVGGPAILIDVDECHYPESPVIQPLFANLDSTSESDANSPHLKPRLVPLDLRSLAGSEPSLINEDALNSPAVKPANLDRVSLAGSEPSLINGDEINPPIAKSANLDRRSLAGSEPSLVNAVRSNSPAAKPDKLDSRSLAGSEPSIVNGEEANLPVAKSASLGRRSLAGSEPSLVNAARSNSPAAKPDKLDSRSLAGSEPSIINGDEPNQPVAKSASLGRRSLAGSEPSLVNAVRSNSPAAKPDKLDSRSLAGSEPSIVNGEEANPPIAKSASLDRRSLAGSEPSIVNGDEIKPPVAKSANLDRRSLAGSEPSLTNGNVPNSPAAKPPKLDLRSLAGSEPSLVEGDDPNLPAQQAQRTHLDLRNLDREPDSPRIQLFENLDARSMVGTEPSLINGEDCNSPKAQPLKSSASSESDYVLIKPEDMERMREATLEAMRFGKEVERIEEEGMKMNALRFELQLAQRQVAFLNRTLEQKNQYLKKLTDIERHSEDNELVEILAEFKMQEDEELKQLIQETTPSLRSIESPKSLSSGELV